MEKPVKGIMLYPQKATNKKLYFIADQQNPDGSINPLGEVKEGDWCLHQVQHEYYLEQAKYDNALLHYKIVATTYNHKNK